MSDKPRCPLRVAGFDQPDTCNPACARLVDVYRFDPCDGKDHHVWRICADTAKALDAQVYDVRPVNVMEVNE